MFCRERFKDDNQKTTQKMNTCQVTEVVPILEAFIRDAEYMAHLAAQFLDECLIKSLGFHKPLCLPAEFLMEVSAVIRIANWQRGALMPVLGIEFPQSARMW